MIVYKITHLASGRGYIGITTGSIEKRWREHRFGMRAGLQNLLYRAMRKYGEEAFRIALLEHSSDVDMLRLREIELIQEHGTYFATGGGFNATYGGDGAHGHDAPKGEASFRAILTDELVAFIRDPANANVSNGDLVAVAAERFGIVVARDTLRDARRGDHWKHLNDRCPPIKGQQGGRQSEKSKAASALRLRLPHVMAAAARASSIRMKDQKFARRLTDEQVKEIFLDPRSNRETATAYGLDHGTVGFIRRRMTWPELTDGLVAPRRRRRAPSHNSVLTEAQVLLIHDDTRIAEVIARQYGVTPQSVYAMRQETSYKYLWGAK